MNFFAPQNGLRENGRPEAVDNSDRCTVAEKVSSLQPPSKSAVLQPPSKTKPVRRLTVNRKLLRNQVSLAQPRIAGNGLYSTTGHLVEFRRLPHDGRR